MTQGSVQSLSRVDDCHTARIQKCRLEGKLVSVWVFCVVIFVCILMHWVIKITAAIFSAILRHLHFLTVMLQSFVHFFCILHLNALCSLGLELASPGIIELRLSFCQVLLIVNNCLQTPKSKISVNLY